jgi:hypothetical protein
MGKSIRSKIKKFHRSNKRREEGPVERQKRALQAVALGALPVEKAPGVTRALPRSRTLLARTGCVRSP